MLIENRYAYGSGKNALVLICSYLKNRKQRVKTNTTFGTWTALIGDVPQGSALVSIFFNIYLNGLYFLPDIHICNFTDDTNPFVYDETLESVLVK